MESLHSSATYNFSRRARFRLVPAVVLALFAVFIPSFATADVVSRKPGPFPDGMDVWFGSTYYTSSQHDGKLLVGGWGDEYNTYVRFNLSGLPQTATQAILWLRGKPLSGSSVVSIFWYLVTGQWHSGSITWSAQPSASPLNSTAAPPADAWYSIDFTSIYNAWRSGKTTLNYGFRMRPTSTNNQFDQFYGSAATDYPPFRPQLDVYYTPQSNDNIIKLRWPPANPAYANRSVNLKFGADWIKYCNGLIKKHTGTDFAVTAGTPVYAAEDGIVRERIFDPNWGYNIVTEHVGPTGEKYTIVYWHVNPVPDVSKSNPGGFIPKGMQIATVYNLGSRTHLHIGLRIGPYTSGVSGRGGLPQQPYCGVDPPFPAGFVDPDNTANVIYQ